MSRPRLVFCLILVHLLLPVAYQFHVAQRFVDYWEQVRGPEATGHLQGACSCGTSCPAGAADNEATRNCQVCRCLDHYVADSFHGVVILMLVLAVVAVFRERPDRRVFQAAIASCSRGPPLAFACS